MQHLGSESMQSRLRSPDFSKNEVQTLVGLVDKYKSILLNKSTNNAVCRAKYLTWAKISKIFNSKGFEHKRKPDCLRVKWDNLKREARRVNKNLLDDRSNDFDDLTSQIVTMINMGEHNTSEIFVPKELEETDDLQIELELEEPKKDTVKYLEDNEDEELSTEMCKEQSPNQNIYLQRIGGENLQNRKRRTISRSMNFTPQESSLLLKCVRQEKKYIFAKDTSNATVSLKNRAWGRIAYSFNRQNPNKRSLSVLRTKFNNMKRLGRTMVLMRKTDRKNNINQGITKLAEDDSDILEKIKTEPRFEADDASEHDEDVPSELNDDSFDALHNTNSTNENIVSPDPLSVIINSDSGIGLMNTESSWNLDNNDNISKLKLELLKCQLENAKLEKKRMEDAIRAESTAIEMRATEIALRLRAARLEATAAAMKLPPQHPALRYTPEENRAQVYINSCEQT